jgi:general secretion pathway protein B
MSYILDALRRAEAERERGEVPSLQSQQHPVIEDDAARRPRPLVWAVVGLSAALLAVVAWSLFGAPAPARAPVEGSVSLSPAPAPLPVAPAVAPAVVAQPAPTSTAPPLPGTTSAVPNTAAPPPAASTAIAPGLGEEIEPAPRRSARSTASRSPSRREEARANAAAHSATTGTARAGAEDHVYTPATLPEEIRRELPKVAINGSSYSGDPASRMVMINGQVFHEGDRLAPDLVLEKIRLKSAVLAYKGWRYELVF